MTNSKSLKRALLTSSISLILCFAMLLGTTFAWFTDSVTSSGNIIKSGNLDVTLHYADGTKAVPAADSNDWTDASTTAIFTYENWEPGYTDVKHIKIGNAGSLALKYQFNITAASGVSKLADVIDVYFIDPAAPVADRAALIDANKVGTLTQVLGGMPANASGTLKADEKDMVTIALKMQESAGNEYQNLTFGQFSVQVIATQLNSEEDSFGDDYDADATYPVATAEALKEAFSNGGTIALSENITLTEELNIENGKEVTLNLNGHNINYAPSTQGYAITNNGELTISGEGEIALAFNGTVNNSKAVNTIANRGTLIINGGKISNTGVGEQIGYAIDNYNGAKLIINGGEITASGSTYYDAIRLFCGSNETTVTVNGGTISSIWAQNPSANKATEVNGTVIINGGTVGTTYYENYTTVKVATGVTTTVTPYGAGSNNTTSATEGNYTVYSFVH